MPNRNLLAIISGRPLVLAAPSMSVTTAAKEMRANAVGSVLVVEEDRLVGIFTERDLMNRVVAADRDPSATALADVMTPNVIGMECDKPLSHALHLMHQNNFRHVPVLRQGKPVGIVSARDALGIEWQQFEREMKIANDISEILA